MPCCLEIVIEIPFFPFLTWKVDSGMARVVCPEMTFGNDSRIWFFGRRRTSNAPPEAARTTPFSFPQHQPDIELPTYSSSCFFKFLSLISSAAPAYTTPAYVAKTKAKTIIVRELGKQRGGEQMECPDTIEQLIAEGIVNDRLEECDDVLNEYRRSFVRNPCCCCPDCWEGSKNSWC